MAKYLDNNGLLYLWQKLKEKFVAKETGKGLSTNDFTNELKTKLDGIENNANKYTLPTASADTLGGVKVGAGLKINDGVLSATGGGTADSVDWSNVQNKPNTLEGYGITDAAPSNHNHDSTYLKLSGGTMTGPIQFSADQGQIVLDDTAAAAKIEMDATAAEIIFTDKTNTKTNRMTVGATGATIAVGETTPGDGTGIQITVDSTNGVKIPMVAAPVNNQDAANKQYVDNAVSGKANSSDVYSKTEINEKGFLTSTDIANKADKATTLAGYGITDAYMKTETYNKEEVDGKLSSVYKPAGNVLFANLPAPSASNLGYVYSMMDAFTTDDRFVASEPTQYPIGTNVVVVAIEGDSDSGTTYLFDVLAGFVDLSGYLKTTDMVAITNQEIDSIVAA